MWINGTHVDNKTLGHPQRIFVVHDSIERVHRFAEKQHITREQAERMLHAACDDENYRNDIWHHRLGDATFEFHLARLKVELRSIKRC